MEKAAQDRARNMLEPDRRMGQRTQTTTSSPAKSVDRNLERKASDRHIAQLVEELIRLSERKSPVEEIADEPKEIKTETSWVPEKKGSENHS